MSTGRKKKMAAGLVGTSKKTSLIGKSAIKEPRTNLVFRVKRLVLSLTAESGLRVDEGIERRRKKKAFLETFTA